MEIFYLTFLFVLPFLFIYFSNYFVSKYILFIILIIILDSYIYYNLHLPVFFIGLFSLIILSWVWFRNEELQKEIDNLKDEINRTIEETNGIRDKND